MSIFLNLAPVVQVSFRNGVEVVVLAVDDQALWAGNTFARVVFAPYGLLRLPERKS